MVSCCRCAVFPSRSADLRRTRSSQLSDRAMAANKEAEISQRPVTGEPLYVIFNLGMSTSFTTVDIADLVFPATMRIVR
jgi:hypothetical protein